MNYLCSVYSYFFPPALTFEKLRATIKTNKATILGKLSKEIEQYGVEKVDEVAKEIFKNYCEPALPDYIVQVQSKLRDQHSFLPDASPSLVVEESRESPRNEPLTPTIDPISKDNTLPTLKSVPKPEASNQSRSPIPVAESLKARQKELPSPLQIKQPDSIQEAESPVVQQVVSPEDLLVHKLKERMELLCQAAKKELRLGDVTALHRKINKLWVSLAAEARLAFEANKPDASEKLKLAELVKLAEEGKPLQPLNELELCFNQINSSKSNDSKLLYQYVILKKSLSVCFNQYPDQKNIFNMKLAELAKDSSKKELFKLFSEIAKDNSGALEPSQHKLEPFFQEFHVIRRGNAWVNLRIPRLKNESDHHYNAFVRYVAEGIKDAPSEDDLGILISYHDMIDHERQIRGGGIFGHALEIFAEKANHPVTLHDERINNKRMRINKKRISFCPLEYKMVRKNRDPRERMRKTWFGIYGERAKRTAAIDKLQATRILRELLASIFDGEAKKITTHNLAQKRDYFMSIQTSDLACLPNSYIGDPAFHEAITQFRATEKILREEICKSVLPNEAVRPSSPLGNRPLPPNYYREGLNKIGSIVIKFIKWVKDIEVFVEEAGDNEKFAEYLEWYLKRLNTIKPVILEIVQLFPPLDNYNYQGSEDKKDLLDVTEEVARDLILQILSALKDPRTQQLKAMIPLQDAVTDNVSDIADCSDIIRALTNTNFFCNTAISNIYDASNHIEQCLWEFLVAAKRMDPELDILAREAYNLNKKAITQATAYNKQNKAFHRENYFPKGRKVIPDKKK